MTDPLKNRFAETIEKSEQELDLAEAALLIATVEYPGLDIEQYLQRIDAMALEVRERLDVGATPDQTIDALNRYLFDERGFAGNSVDYYDPRNSFLNDVIDRRLGIPITLSVLYLEIGRRLDLELEGVSFPGHFLVKLRAPGGERLLDPFFKGMTLDEETLEQRVEEAFGPQQIPEDQMEHWLLGATKREILARMLRNLKGVYLHAGNHEKALLVVDRLLLLLPDSSHEVRDRGLLYDKLEHHGAAVADYTRYLQLDPQAEDAAEIRQRLAVLSQVTGRIN